VDTNKTDAGDGSPQTQVVQRIRYRDDGEGWRGNAFSQLFIVDLNGDEPLQLTRGEGDHLAPVWSPEGARIAFVCDALEGRDFSRYSEVRVITLDGGEPVPWSKGMTRAGSVAWSHDGHQLVAAGSHDPDVWDPRQSWLYVLEQGLPARVVAGEFRAVVQPIPAGCWTRNDDLIYIADQAGESYLCSVHADGGEEEVVYGGEQTLTSVCVNGDKAVVVSGTTDRPCGIYEIDLKVGTAIQRTEVNVRLLADRPPASVEKITFERNDVEIQARLLFPQDFDESNTYPLILEIHGGPNGRFSDSFDVTQQILSGRGYLVLAVNPRGSSSYGPEFLKAVLRDWGGEDYLDLMAAVDLVSERPYVHTDRLGVHGYSYGGFMSSWIIGHDHRFKAAVIGAPCINLHSMYGTSDIGVSFGENQWGGSSIEKVEALVDRSPLTYASEVTTPALLLHGEQDYRCPIEQSEQFYVALKRQKKDVEFVRFPDSSHGFRKAAHPKLREEYYQRMVDWFGKYLGKQ
jgi:dipeptidyl aminopeptidase/acylaminoacyl peptidase